MEHIKLLKADAKQIFEWIKTGVIKRHEFEEWQNNREGNAYSAGIFHQFVSEHGQPQ
jgi:hypothetical protein